MGLEPNINIASHFQQAAANDASRIALIWEDGEVTYRELMAMVQSLRRSLPRRPRIGILSNNCPASYAAVLAILGSGAAYVPLNSIFPAARNAKIVELADLDTLVVGEECAESFASLLSLVARSLEVLTLGDAPSIRRSVSSRADVTLREAPPLSDLPILEPEKPVDGTAYILFTSGSTGEPKGVRVLHRNVESYLKSFLATFPLTPEDRLSQTFDLTFDPSVQVQFATWTAGATLVDFPDRALASPLDFARERAVTVWFSVPSLPAFLESSRLARDNALPDIRLSLFGGEKFTWNALQAWNRIAPNGRCANLYGPTEATIAITAFDIPADFPESACHLGVIPIGKPFPGQSVEIRREDGSICALKEEGMLWLGGDQLTPGYLDPVKTAELFVESRGGTWYKSGDIGFSDDDGNINYVGRADFQVKVMGYRIELGEIESALLRASGAAFAVAEVARLRGDVDEIVCVLPTACAPMKKRIRDEIKVRLPSYMMPRVWKFQEDLPLNPNGKVDRIALKSSWTRS